MMPLPECSIISGRHGGRCQKFTFRHIMFFLNDRARVRNKSGREDAVLYVCRECRRRHGIYRFALRL